MTQPAEPLARLRTALIHLMAEHRGRDNGLHVRELAKQLGTHERQVRQLITQLRRDEGMPICAHPSTGYYLAASPSELDATCEFLQRRAMTSLTLLSQMRNVSMPALLQQLRLHQA